MLNILELFCTFATWLPYDQLWVNADCILIFHDCPEGQPKPCNESWSIRPAKYPMQFEPALQRHIENPVEHLRLSFFAKIVNDF